MGEAHHQNHRVYIMEYHLILVVKYRKKCITPEIGQFLVAEADRLLRTWNGYVVCHSIQKNLPTLHAGNLYVTGSL